MLLPKPASLSLLGPADCSCFICRECAPRFSQFEQNKNGEEISQCPGCNKLVTTRFMASELGEKEALKFEERTCKKRLARLPGWKFCHTPDCLNGQVLRRVSLFFSCELCTSSGCIDCGLNHQKGSASSKEQFKHLEHLLLGKFPAPAGGHPQSLTSRLS